MTLQNDHILLEEAHRRVAENLREIELDQFGRSPRTARRTLRTAVVATGATVIALLAAMVGMVGLLP
jgi:hypothetical protein